MHDCQRFREDFIGDAVSEVITECDDCRRFCEESQAALLALDFAASRIPQVSEEYWTGFESRLRTRLVEENAILRVHASYRRWFTALAVAAAIVIAVTWGSLHASRPVLDQASLIQFDNDHISGLDPRVVNFLGQSELFVRDFTKINPAYKEEIEDARDRASRNLAAIAEQKRAAGDFAPVRITLDEYESVLREIKNLETPEDLADIQNRIQRNGLIASLKAYQPRVVLVSQW